MKARWPLVVSLVCLALAALAGQQPVAQPALSSQQKEGRRIFQQKCAVCHLPIIPSDGSVAPYAPLLRKSRVEGNEESMRRIIADGTALRMPGWKYTLREDQIEAILSYLKTIETPRRTLGVPPSEL